MVRDARVGRVVRPEELLDARPDDLARVQPRGVDQPAGRVGEAEVAIDRPDGARAAGGRRGAGCCPAPADPRAPAGRRRGGRRRSPARRTGRAPGEREIPAVPPLGPSGGEGEDAQDPIAGHERHQHHRSEPSARTPRGRARRAGRRQGSSVASAMSSGSPDRSTLPRGWGESASAGCGGAAPRAATRSARRRRPSRTGRSTPAVQHVHDACVGERGHDDRADRREHRS